MGLITGREIREVFPFGHVGFCHHHTLRVHPFEQGPQQFHQQVGAGMVNAGAAGLFPDIANGVQAQPSHAVGHHPVQQRGIGKQDGIAVPVHIHLIRTKGGPNRPQAGLGLERGEQVAAAGAHHLRPVVVGIGCEHAVDPGRLPLAKLLHPGVGSGHMIEHQIGHQLAPLAEGFEVLPTAEVLLQ